LIERRDPKAIDPITVKEVIDFGEPARQERFNGVLPARVPGVGLPEQLFTTWTRPHDEDRKPN
jgi:hypothetical protein